MIEELERELGLVGIRGRLRRRIVAELRDHLSCDPEAEPRLGEPRELAQQFADELGTALSRRAAYLAFAALGLAGLAYAISFVVEGGLAAAPDAHARSAFLGSVAGAAAVVAPQVSFVSGSLALLRAVRRRSPRALPAAEVQVLVRRTGLALAAGAAALGGTALYAYEYRLGTGIAYAGVGIGAAALLVATAPVLAAARVRATSPGARGDVFADLGGLAGKPFHGDAWRLARTVALLAGLAVCLAGIAQGDPLDGLVRGAAEALACLGGFALLGRFLGLRR